MYSKFKKDLHSFTNTNKSKSFIQKIHRLRQNPGMKMVLWNRFINETPKIFSPIKIILIFIYRRMMVKYGIYLPLDLSFGYNLRIYHHGEIIINPNAKIGNDVTIMQGVTIGNNMKNTLCPIINNGVFIGAGAKVLGDIIVEENTKIGANAVVTKNFRKKILLLLVFQPRS